MVKRKTWFFALWWFPLISRGFTFIAMVFFPATIFLPFLISSPRDFSVRWSHSYHSLTRGFFRLGVNDIRLTILPVEKFKIGKWARAWIRISCFSLSLPVSGLNCYTDVEGDISEDCQFNTGCMKKFFIKSKHGHCFGISEICFPSRNCLPPPTKNWPI